MKIGIRIKMNDVPMNDVPSGIKFKINRDDIMYSDIMYKDLKDITVDYLKKLLPSIEGHVWCISHHGVYELTEANLELFKKEFIIKYKVSLLEFTPKKYDKTFEIFEEFKNNMLK
jgi:hypothetical protein